MEKFQGKFLCTTSLEKEKTVSSGVEGGRCLNKLDKISLTCHEPLSVQSVCTYDSVRLNLSSPSTWHSGTEGISSPVCPLAEMPETQLLVSVDNVELV